MAPFGATKRGVAGSNGGHRLGGARRRPEHRGTRCGKGRRGETGTQAAEEAGEAEEGQAVHRHALSVRTMSVAPPLAFLVSVRAFLR